MDWFTIMLQYITIGVIFNLVYDLVINHIQKEELRFNMIERIVFTIIWPIYVIVFIFNAILTIIKHGDKD